MKPKKGNFEIVSSGKKCWLCLEVCGEVVWHKRITFAEKKTLVNHGTESYVDSLADLDD